MWPFLIFDSIADILLAAMLAAVFLGPLMPPMPQDAHPTKTASIEKVETFADNGGAEYRVSAKINGNNRCLVRASVNGHGPLVFIADSGAPDLWFNVKDLPQLGISRSSLHFAPFVGDDREGNVAWVTLADVRIGNFVAHNINAAISDKANYRLMGMSVLKQGHMEVEGDTCSLTFPRNVGPHAPFDD
jgi:predicted aspartyl protease